MVVMSLGTSSLAHGVHYGVLVVGLLGLVALLAPQWVGAPGDPAPRDEHEARIADLQRQIASGSLGTATTSALPATYQAPERVRVMVPIMVVSSTAAAGVHAAMGPLHFRELPLFGIFFIAAAIAQIGWSAAMVLAPHRTLVGIAVLGNLAILLLWLVTRTVGLPFGLMPSPEAVGPWDLSCAAWEVVVVTAGLAILRRSPLTTMKVPLYDEWPNSARVWLVGSVVLLGALTMSGASG